MKRLAAPIIAVFLLLPAQRADALFGIGLKYVSDSFSVGEWTDGDDVFTLTGGGLMALNSGGSLSTLTQSRSSILRPVLKLLGDYMI